MTNIIPVPQIEQQLAAATTMRQTRKVEAVSAAAMAYADEEKNYELFMSAWRVYELARIKTTELYTNNTHVMDDEILFTAMQ